MRIPNPVLIVLIGAVACSPAAEDSLKSLPEALAQEVDRLASTRTLWPGFEPGTIPLAVYDGQYTYLFRHPAPPEGFVPSPDRTAGVLLYEGRHPSVSANTNADIGGTMSATMMLDATAESADLAGLAAVALHEAFHVFQREQHPTWQANEADLFVYPFEDPDLLALRRLETVALERALAAADDTESACWTHRALELRSQRFAALDEPFVAYERGTELNEGLAAYVQHRAEGQDDVDFPDGGFPPEAVRQRAYSTGTALALQLDRFRPDWPVAFEADDDQALDEALSEALRDSATAECGFRAEEIANAEDAAALDVETLLARRGERRAAFEELSGWRIVTEAADGQPLWPQGFDPLNVERLDNGVLHTRFLKLGNDSGQLEAIDTASTDLESLTKGAGSHPLFNGVRRVVIAGLNEPEVETDGASVTLRADGVSMSFAGAEVQRDEGTLIVRLGVVE